MAVPTRFKTLVVATVAASAATVAVMAVPATAAPAPAVAAAAAVKSVECRANILGQIKVDRGRTCSAVSERGGFRAVAEVKGNRATCTVNGVVTSSGSRAKGCRVKITTADGPLVAIVRPA